MSKPLDSIHHIALQVKNISRAVNWYKENYSCDIEYQDESWAMLKFANISLALVLPEQHPYHVAIVAQDLRRYGEPQPHRDGTASVYIKDADGNNLEMLRLPDNDDSQ